MKSLGLSAIKKEKNGITFFKGNRMLEKISELMKEAMKAKQKDRLKALRYVKSLLLENKTSKSPVEEQDVVIKYYKKLNDSLELYKNDTERLDELQAEIKVVEEFMPVQLCEADVIAIIDEIIKGLDSPNMGAVMKELSPKIKGQFNGKAASGLVRAALA